MSVRAGESVLADRQIAGRDLSDAVARAAPVAIPVALTVIAAVSMAAASVFRHGRFGSNAYDLGIYDQTLWGLSRFDIDMSITVGGGTPNLIGGHFQPLLVLLTPLYWIWADPRVLLVAQAIVLALGGLPLYAWARQELGLASATLFQVAYLIFFGLVGGNLYDFHPVCLAAPIVSLALYALLTGRTTLLLVTAALGLLVKEDVSLTIAAIGVYAIVVQGRYRVGAAIVAASLAWFLVVLKLILPAVTGAKYAHWFYPGLGSGPGAAVKTLVTDPIESARVFFTPHAKRVALANLFGAWLFLPLLSPLLIVAIPTLGERFFSDKPEYWAQGFHYSIVLAPILAFAAVDTARRVGAAAWLRTAPWARAALAVAVVVAGAYQTFGRLRPLDELGRYTSAAHAAEIDACLRTIPDGASVAATSALVPHLSQRREIYLVDNTPRPATEFIALDTYTWTFPLGLGDIGTLVRESFAAGYGVRCTNPGTVVLKRGRSGRTLDPALARRLAGAA